MIEIIDEQGYLSNEQHLVLNDILALATQMLGLTNIEIDLSIVNNELIHELNQTYRGIDAATDVLSFALEEDVPDAPTINIDSSELGSFPRHLGDIVISYPQAQEQAQEYGHSLERELAFLAVHGFLHLNGYDHQTEAEEQEMFKIQNEVLEKYGLSR